MIEKNSKNLITELQCVIGCFLIIFDEYKGNRPTADLIYGGKYGISPSKPIFGIYTLNMPCDVL